MVEHRRRRRDWMRFRLTLEAQRACPFPLFLGAHIGAATADRGVVHGTIAAITWHAEGVDIDLANIHHP